MPVNSKRKGSDGENELAKILRGYGYPNVRRSQQYCGGTEESADLVGLPNVFIECKRVQNLNLHQAMRKAIDDCEKAGSDKLKAIFHRKNREQWLVTMTLEEWIQLYGLSDYSDKDEVEEEDGTEIQ